MAYDFCGKEIADKALRLMIQRFILLHGPSMEGLLTGTQFLKTCKSNTSLLYVAENVPIFTFSGTR